jgi:hypothetical protein
LSADPVKLFGGKYCIEAADPLQNATINDANESYKYPYYTDEKFYSNFYVGLLYDECNNHRFVDTEWIALLNRIRRNEMKLEDIKTFESYIGKTLSIDDCTDEPMSTLRQLMDLVNTLVVRDRYEEDFKDGRFTKCKDIWKSLPQQRYLVFERVEKYYSLLNRMMNLKPDFHTNMQKPYPPRAYITNKQLFEFYELSR